MVDMFKAMDKELDTVDDCFDSTDINDIEMSTLYFISGYVAKMENLGGDETEATMPLKQKSCEFTVQLSRGSTRQRTCLLYPDVFTPTVKRCQISHDQRECWKHSN